MLKINDKNVDCISKKEIKIIKSIVNKSEGFGIEINVNFTINNIEGYFTLNFAHQNNNDINTFINKTYKGNWYSCEKKPWGYIVTDDDGNTHNFTSARFRMFFTWQ